VIDKLRKPLHKLYRALKSVAPNARILVVGYPQIFPKSPAEQSCKELSVWLGEQNMLRRLDKRMNDLIERTAKRDGLEFVDVRARFAGHEVCGKRGSWLNGPDPALTLTKKFPWVLKADDESFHPNAKGQRRGYGAAINEALETGGP
jgi:hypothetical protein